jgi:Na+-translocating ferredoxin:NAD+ oxidoreductase RnfD subunit
MEIPVSKRYFAPILNTVILVGAHVSFGILGTWEVIAVAIGTSVAIELALGRLVHQTWVNPSSAYISGISVAILVRSPDLWPYVVCAMLSIASKYVLRYRGRHLWNPSNFGICAILLLAPFAVAPLSIQWGNNLWPMLVIWTIGLVAIWRLKRAHVTLSYGAAFFVFAGVRSWVTGDPYLAEVAPITGPMYQLFALFMITDPKTTVRSYKGEIAVAVAVAFVEMLFRFGESVYAPFYALAVVGPAAMLIESWWSARTESRTRSRTEGHPEAHGLVEAPEEDRAGVRSSSPVVSRFVSKTG